MVNTSYRTICPARVCYDVTILPAPLASGRVVHRAPLPALLLLAPLLWLFRSVLFFGEVFAFRDSAHYYFPLYRFVQESWATGLPLWNPFDGIGQPLLGDPTAAVLYPGKLLFCLPMEYRVCFAIYVVAHLWLAGVGAFYCAQHFRTGWHGALLAGFSYELGGHVLFQYCNPVFSVGAAWLPWGLLLTEQIVTGVGRGTYLDGKHSLLTLRRESVLFAGVLTLMVLGGGSADGHTTAYLSVGCAHAFFRAGVGKRCDQSVPLRSLLCCCPPYRSCRRSNGQHKATGRCGFILVRSGSGRPIL